jgi:hypothetical protein
MRLLGPTDRSPDKSLHAAGAPEIARQSNAALSHIAPHKSITLIRQSFFGQPAREFITAGAELRAFALDLGAKVMCDLVV